MTRNRLPLLKRIVGGIKRNMFVVWFGLGIMVIPLAAYALVEDANVLVALLLFILGIIAIILSLVEKHKEDKRENIKYITQLELTMKASENLIDEIRGLREDVRGRNNSDTKM